MNVFEDCGSTKCEAIWYQLGSKTFDPNIIFVHKQTKNRGQAAAAY